MANQIRHLRESQGLTLEQLGDLVGTSAQQISRLEKGERRLSQGWMERIAPALSVKAADLILDTAPDSDEIAQKIENSRVLEWWGLLKPDQKQMIAGFARNMGLDILANDPKKRRG